MDDGAYKTLPPLSAEALRLITRSGLGYALPVDLRPFFALEREYGPAVTRAASVWKLPTEKILPMFHVQMNRLEPT